MALTVSVCACVCACVCVQNRDCVQQGPPAQGEVVQVRWTDGLVYGAKFVAAHVIQMYQVRREQAIPLLPLLKHG